MKKNAAALLLVMIGLSACGGSGGGTSATGTPSMSQNNQTPATGTGKLTIKIADPATTAKSIITSTTSGRRELYRVSITNPALNPSFKLIQDIPVGDLNTTTFDLPLADGYSVKVIKYFEDSKTFANYSAERRTITGTRIIYGEPKTYTYTAWSTARDSSGNPIKRYDDTVQILRPSMIRAFAATKTPVSVRTSSATITLALQTDADLALTLPVSIPSGSFNGRFNANVTDAVFSNATSCISPKGYLKLSSTPIPEEETFSGAFPVSSAFFTAISSPTSPLAENGGYLNDARVYARAGFQVRDALLKQGESSRDFVLITGQQATFLRYSSASVSVTAKR